MDPLGLPALLIGPYPSTEVEERTLGTSFETSLGRDWQDGQNAIRIQARLDHQPFHPYSVLWVPCSSNSDQSDTTEAAVEKIGNGQGILTIWPTHLLSRSESPRTRMMKPSLASSEAPLESHLDLMTTASSLFETMSNYRDPVPEITPPGDQSFEDPPVEDDGSAAGTTTPLPAGIPAQPIEGDDDLEDLFASDTPARSPEPFGSYQPFEMFGDQNDRRSSVPNNAHLIDYGDVVMSSPPATEERRDSLRPTMVGDGAIDEPDPTLVTEDDFNFFDSPTDNLGGKDDGRSQEAQQGQPEPSPSPELTGISAVPETRPEAQATDIPVQDDKASAEPKDAQSGDVPVQHPEPSTRSIDPSPGERIDPAAAIAPSSLELNKSTEPRSTVANQTSAKSHFVPSAFEPLNLTTRSGTTFAYSLPSPAPTPQSLNEDLMIRLSSPKATKQAYDYAAAWLFDAPVSEVDDEEYTGPPTPISYLDENDDSTAGPTPMVQSKAGPGELEYEGLPCVTTEWFVMVDDGDRQQQLSRPWMSGWGNDTPPAPKENQTPKSAPKKRKRQSEDDSSLDEVDLDVMAAHIVANSELRWSLALSSRHDDICSATAAVTDELRSGGVTLADFVEPDADNEEVEAAERKQLGPSAFSQCTIHAGFRGNVIRLSIAALRYWRELDLQPLSGSKDIKAVVLHDRADGDVSSRKDFIRLASTYKVSMCRRGHACLFVLADQGQSLGLGECNLDSAFGNAGLMNAQGKKGTPIADPPGNLDLHHRLDVFAQALAWVEKQDRDAAVFVMCDSAKRCRFETYFAASKVSTLPPNQVVQVIPSSSFAHRDNQDLARSLYDRFPRQLRLARPAENGIAPWFLYPAFTLCPESPPKPNLTLSWPIKSFDVFGSWRWVHGAYARSSDGRNISIMVSDAEGENWQVKVLRGLHSKSWSEVVSMIWTFLRDFSAGAAIEWRLSVCRLGVMEKLELDGEYLPLVTTSRRLMGGSAWRQLYVTSNEPMSIMMSEAASSSDLAIAIPRNGPPNVQPGIVNDPTTIIADESLAGSHFVLPHRQPVVVENSTVYPESSFLVSLATPTLDHDTSCVHLLFHRPAPGKDDEEAETVLARELYRIGCWSRVKFGFDGLPGHLAAVKAIIDGLAAMEE